MKTATTFLWVILLTLMVAGCKTEKGPKFDPYLADLLRRSEQWPGGFHTNLQFQSVQITNANQVNLLTPPKDFYRLGPGDVVDVEVLGEDASTTQVIVGPDGKIYYSLLPGIFVWGLTLSETKTLLEDSLAKYLLFKPDISMVLRAVASKRIWIMGKVSAPGVYTLGTPMTLLEAISSAGGTPVIPGSSEDSVDYSRSFVMRDGKLLNVDFHRLFKKGDLSQNIYLHTGDYVYLNPAETRHVYVLGMVAAPNVVPYSRNMSLVGAIAYAGGPVQYAHLSQVAIIRGSLSQPKVAVVDFKKMVQGDMPNVRLEPGDVVYVPLAPWSKLQEFANNMLNTLVSTIALNEGINAVDDDADPIQVNAPNN